MSGPTDEDRALAATLFEPDDAIITDEDIKRFAVVIAQARREGAEAMRERAAQYCDTKVEWRDWTSECGYGGPLEGVPTDAAFAAEWLAAAIRALPTGEGS